MPTNLCSICGVPCRGACTTCQAPLCARHKPPGERTKHATRRRQPRPRPILRLPRAPVSSSGSSLGTLTLSEQSAWIATRRTALQKKQARELAYLDRRAARGTHTPTDDAYEEDQVLEQDLFEALDLLEQLLQQGQSPALGSDASLQLAYPDPDKITP